MEMTTRAQILDVTDSVSHHANPFWEEYEIFSSLNHQLWVNREKLRIH